MLLNSACKISVCGLRSSTPEKKGHGACLTYPDVQGVREKDIVHVHLSDIVHEDLDT